MDSDTNDVYLAPAEYIDSDHPAITAFVARTIAPGTPATREGAAALSRGARDPLRSRSRLCGPGDLSAPRACSRPAPAIASARPSLFAALCRAAGLPARVAFADVTNHLSSEKLREKMGTNYFAWHGFTEVLLGERWVKASPTFNATLCDRFGVAALDFDGASDALLQAYDGDGAHLHAIRGAARRLP